MSAHAETRPTSESTSECLVTHQEQVSVEASEPEAAELPEDEMNDGDKDSAIGTIEPSSVESLPTSIWAYRRIGGRDYHSERWDTPCWLPIDEPQLEAQRFAHEATLILLDEKLHLAPLEEDIERVLDVGTGEGLWAIEFADCYPDVEVFGTDISPVQDTEVPPKLRFIIEDCTDDWTWDDEYFDFVHLRGLAGSISDWPHLFSQAYRHTKPGGFVESHEASFRFQSDHGSIEAGSPLAIVGAIFEEAGVKIGCPFAIADGDEQRESMEKTGFVVVRETKLKMPIGKWPLDPKYKDAGKLASIALHSDLEGYLFYVTAEILRWGYVEAQVFLANVRRQLRQDKMYVYVEHHVVVGQKPSSESGPNV